MKINRLRVGSFYKIWSFRCFWNRSLTICKWKMYWNIKLFYFTRVFIGCDFFTFYRDTSEKVWVCFVLYFKICFYLHFFFYYFQCYYRIENLDIFCITLYELCLFFYPYLQNARSNGCSMRFVPRRRVTIGKYALPRHRKSIFFARRSCALNAGKTEWGSNAVFRNRSLETINLEYMRIQRVDLNLRTTIHFDVILVCAPVLYVRVYGILYRHLLQFLSSWVKFMTVGLTRVTVIVLMFSGII